MNTTTMISPRVHQLSAAYAAIGLARQAALMLRSQLGPELLTASECVRDAMYAAITADALDGPIDPPLFLSSQQIDKLVADMRKYGGGFVQGFADCLARADTSNTARLLAAFPDLVKRYGPGSEFDASANANANAQPVEKMFSVNEGHGYPLRLFLLDHSIDAGMREWAESADINEVRPAHLNKCRLDVRRVA